MISEEEKKLLKTIDNYKCGDVLYYMGNLFIYSQSKSFIRINIDYEESLNKIVNTVYDEDLYDEDEADDNFIEKTINLSDLYGNNDILKEISINSLNINIPTTQNNILELFFIIRLYSKYFFNMPTVGYSYSYDSFVYNDPFDICYCPSSNYDGETYEIELEKNQYLTYDFLNDIFSYQYQRSDLKILDKYYNLINYEGKQDFLKRINLTLLDIKTLTTQTKVRRLGYLKMILSLFSKSSYYPDSIFNKKIELEAEKYNKHLLEYKNAKGIIDITKSGNSSKPYIETSLSLKLLYSQNNRYQLSKYGKIFNILSNKIEESTNNYFSLSKYEKSFFLFFIMQNDNLYLWALVDLIYIQNNKTTIKEIKKSFQEYILNQLQFTINYSSIQNKEKSKISSLIKRINSWKKPQVYLEHIIEPRVNWLLDLDLLDKDEFLQNNLVLSKEGYSFFCSLNSYFDIFQEKYTMLDHLRCMDFFSLINEMYSMDATDIEEEDIELIENYINESFNLFKTIAPNRVTASQAILYTCFMMLFKAKKVVNFCTIQNYLASKKNTKFIFEWYKTEKDGSIRRKK